MTASKFAELSDNTLCNLTILWVIYIKKERNSFILIYTFFYIYKKNLLLYEKLNTILHPSLHVSPQPNIDGLQNIRIKIKKKKSKLSSTPPILCFLDIFPTSFHIINICTKGHSCATRIQPSSLGLQS